MNATTDNPSKDQSIGDGTPKGIAVRIKSPLAIPLFLPNGNRIAVTILEGAFNRALEAENLLLTFEGGKGGVVGVGELNDSFFSGVVSQAQPALAALEKILDHCNLRPIATLLVFNRDEDAFLPYGPDNAGASCGFSLERMKQEASLTHEYQKIILELAEKCQARTLQAPPENPT